MDDSTRTPEELRAEIHRLEERVRGIESALARSFADFSSLQEREERLRLLVENLPDVSWTTDSSGHTVYISPQVEKIYGFTPAEIFAAGDALWFGRIHPDDLDRVRAAFEELRTRGSAFDVEYRIRHKNGEYIWLHDRAFARSTKEGKRFAHGIFRDISSHRRAEEDRHRSQEQAQLFIDRMPLGCIMWDTGFRVALWNPAAERIFGYPSGEALGMQAHELIASDPVRRNMEEIWKRLMAGDATAHSIIENRTRDGRKIVCEWYNTPIREASGAVAFVLSMVMDVTDRQRAEEERRKLEAQLQQSQKMEAIGLLAGGVAHDFNNILSAILGYASILQMKMRPDDPLRPNVEQVLAASQRAASLTQSLLAFSRKQIINPQPLLVNESLRKIEKLLRRIIGEDIEITTVYAEPDMTTVVDAGQLEQVIINLATNARDAMPQGGAITVETRRTLIDEEFIRNHGYGKAGTYAMIAVSDTGTGMDEKTHARIFEPFFTTKELGKGTGLGLSTAYGIVKQNNGYITCDSEPGAGTTFRIYLPAVDARARKASAVEPIFASRGTETVLIAEDDQAMRSLFRSLLEDHGYTVITAVDGDDAVAKFRKRSDDIGLIVLDVVMPKKNGKEVYEEARRVRPGVKTLFISGYTADIVKRKGIIEEGLHFLSKPATPAAFLKAVRDVLDGK